MVSRVVAEENWASEVIFNIAAGDRTEWTPLDWQAVLSDLDRCKLKVEDWVNAQLNTNVVPDLGELSMKKSDGIFNPQGIICVVLILFLFWVYSI